MIVRTHIFKISSIPAKEYSLNQCLFGASAKDRGQDKVLFSIPAKEGRQNKDLFYPPLKEDQRDKCLFSTLANADVLGILKIGVIMLCL